MSISLPRTPRPSSICTCLTSAGFRCQIQPQFAATERGRWRGAKVLHFAHIPQPPQPRIEKTAAILAFNSAWIVQPSSSIIVRPLYLAPPFRVPLAMPALRLQDRSLIVAFALIATAPAGCARLPDFAHPGPAPIQRARAIQHDPYPLNDLGPEVVGGRPREYQQSLPEAERAKLGSQRPALQPLPLPGTAVTAPPVASSPFAVPPPQPGMPLNNAPPPIVTSPATAPPVASPPLGAAAPVYTSPPPVVTTPLPGSSPAQSGTFPAQQRPSY